MGVTPLTIRNWDQKGKLTACRNPMNNYRLYNVEDVEKLLRGIELSKESPRTKVIMESKRETPPAARKLKIDIL